MDRLLDSKAPLATPREGAITAHEEHAEAHPRVRAEFYGVTEDAADSTEFVAGVITLAEFIDRVRARYRVPADYDWDRIGDVVLYDIFYEAGTQLGTGSWPFSVRQKKMGKLCSFYNGSNSI